MKSLEERVAILEQRADMPVHDGHPLWRPAEQLNTGLLLSACPHCGSPAAFNETEAGGNYVSCTRCRASTCLYYSCGEDAKPMAAEAWNRRVEPALTELEEK